MLPGPPARVRLASAVLVLTAGVAGCSGGGTALPDQGTPVPVPDTSTAAAGCGVGQGPAPVPGPGAATADVGDVDGDGRTDTAWLAPGTGGATTLGITAAAGGSSAISVLTPGPADPSLLVADVDGDGRTELLLSDGRTVDLYAFESCTVTPVLRADGTTYEVRVGPGGDRTGIGCTTLDGTRRLVLLARGVSSATRVDFTATVVRIDGLLAREGSTASGTYALPADREAADLLTRTTCGDRTVETAGVTLPR